MYELKSVIWFQVDRQGRVTVFGCPSCHYSPSALVSVVGLTRNSEEIPSSERSRISVHSAMLLGQDSIVVKPVMYLVSPAEIQMDVCELFPDVTRQLSHHEVVLLIRVGPY